MESYYLAKGSGKEASLSLQVQRLHATSHADPVYDLRQKQVSRKKIKRAIDIANPLMCLPYPSTPSDSDLLLYDGSIPPVASDQDEPIYTASSYDEPTLRSIQLSSHGVLFSPLSTPYLHSSGPRRARIDSLPSSSGTTSPVTGMSGLSSSSSSTTKNSTRRDSLIGGIGGDDLVEHFLGQPVCWLLVLSKTNYKLIDQVTGSVIGKWMRPNAGSTVWNFVVKGATVATMNGNNIQLSNSGEGETFVDEFSYNLRRRYLSKNTMTNGAFSPGLRQQILSGAASSGTSELELNARKNAKKINIYRARVLDGVLFSGIALKLAEKGRSRSSSPDTVQDSLMYARRSTIDTLGSDKKRKVSGIFSSIKQVWS
jgi:hypothetical protein